MNDRQARIQATVPGGKCVACGHVFAPAQSFGCERCGAFGDRIVPVELAAAGRVASVATVHVHRFPTPPAPFGIAEVALDAGPVIRVLTAGDLTSGDCVTRGADGPDGLPRFVVGGAA